MNHLDDLKEPDQGPEVCTGDPFACPCEAFRIDVEADRAKESDEGQDAA